MYKDKAGEFRFNVVAANGETVASSEGYTSKAGCLNGIHSIKENATHARIEDQTKQD
ncbi:MAG: YegP family protein [Candidatus Ranarchaeia archaeon]